MRLLTRRLHRAFPELDRYTDEQCRRFMRSARRGRRLLFATVWVVVVAIGLCGSAYLGDQLYEWSNNYQHDQRRDVPWLNVATALALGGMLAAPFGVALVVRDEMMRRRVKVILSEDSSCPQCKYGLLGLAVEADSTIKCPECGYICQVDPSLSELTLDAAGKQQLRPVIVLPAPPPLMKRRGVRIGIRVTLVLILLPIVIWLGFFGWLSRQASFAKTARQELSTALSAYAGSRLPHEATVRSEQHPDLAGLIQAATEVDREFWTRASTAAPTWGTSAALGPVLKGNGSAADQLTLDLVAAYRKAGVFERLRQFQQSGQAIYPGRLSPYAGVAMTSMIAKVIEINTARMELARWRSEWPEYCDAMESNLAVARILRHQDYTADLASACDIEARTLARVRAVLASQPDQACVDAIQAAIKRQRTELPVGLIFEGDRLASQIFTAEQYVQVVGEDVSNFDSLRYLWMFRRYGSRLGSYSENRECLDAYFKDFEAAASQPPYLRAPLKGFAANNLGLLGGVPDLRFIVLEKVDRNVLDRHGVDVLLALEAFRLTHGEYPNKLEELTPSFLAALPVDPWSGKTLGYKLVDAAKDPGGRQFLLYSCGFDKTDDGGSELPGGDPEDLLRLRPGSGLGFDYIINASPRASKPPVTPATGGAP